MLIILIQQYERDGRWVYEQHPFWCTGYTFWDLHSEAPDLFLHLSRSDLVFFKGDLNHRKLTYDCAAPASTPFDIAIGPMASAAGAPKVCSLRTIKSDVVVGLGDDGDRIAEQLDKNEPGWKISGKYVRDIPRSPLDRFLMDTPPGCCSAVRRSSRRKGPFCVTTSQMSLLEARVRERPMTGCRSPSSCRRVRALVGRALSIYFYVSLLYFNVQLCMSSL